MIGVVNEPVQNPDQVVTMRSSFYPNAYAAIRSAESALGVTSNNFLHVQFMNTLWNSGDPNQYLTNTYFASYDDHRYLKWDSRVPVSQSSYVQTSCNDNRGGNTPAIVGEFSLSVPDDVQWTDGWHPNSQQAFYKKVGVHFLTVPLLSLKLTLNFCSGLQRRLLVMREIHGGGCFGPGRLNWAIIDGLIKVCVC
jgi:hypothetical protein